MTVVELEDRQGDHAEELAERVCVGEVRLRLREARCQVDPLEPGIVVVLRDLPLHVAQNQRGALAVEAADLLGGERWGERSERGQQEREQGPRKAQTGGRAGVRAGGVAAAWILIATIATPAS